MERLAVIAALLGLPALLHAQASLPRLVLVEERRIGSLDGPDALSAVYGLLTDQALTRLFVRQAAEIKMFEPRTGKFLRTIGRRGPGPAEFTTMGPIGWKQDTLALIERRDPRLLMFSSGGEFIRSARLPLVSIPGKSHKARPSAIAPDGAFWAEPLPNDARSGGVIDIVLSEPDGRFRRHVGTYLNTITDERVPFGNGMLIFTPPLKQRSFSAYAPDGSSVLIVDAPANADRFTIMRARFSGDTVYRREYRYAPRAVPRVVRDSIHREWARLMERRIGRSSALATARSLIPIPDFLPPVSSIHLDWDGRAWLRTEDLGTATVRWLLYGPDGRLQATIDAPTTLTIMAAKDDRVIGVRQGDLDIPQIVSYRLKAAAPTRGGR